MCFFSCSDSDFWTVHDSIIKKQTSKYSAPSSNSGESTQVLVLLVTVREICYKSVNLADGWFAAPVLSTTFDPICPVLNIQ